MMKLNRMENFYLLDRENLFDVLRNSYTQIESAWSGEYDLSCIDGSAVKNVIISGVGGSAISGDILKNFIKDEFKNPILVNRGYSVPEFCGPETLVIVCSYSGETEETLSAFSDAIARGAQIIALTTGGKLGELAARSGTGLMKLEKGYQPRFALYNIFFVLLRVFQDLGLIPDQNEDVKDIMLNIKKLADIYSREEGLPFSIARSLEGVSPVIYSVSDFNDSAGKRFKAQLNENSKVHAWSGEYPEMNHHEIVGWQRAGNGSVKYKVVNFIDPDMHQRILKRVNIINELLESEGIDIINIKSDHKKSKVRLLDVLYLCDWVSYFLGLLNGEDPGEIDFINHLKKKIAED